MKATLFIFSLFIAICFADNFGDNPDNKKLSTHECKYSLCPFKGKVRFVSGCGNCDSGSDCWALDSIHFTNPALDYDSCENLLFTKQ